MPVRINRCRASSKPIDEAAWLARVANNIEENAAAPLST